MIDSWFDPPKEAAATETLINLGCDIVTTHTDSPGPLQILEQKGLYGFGQGADMSSFAPHAHLTAIEDNWGPYYVERAKAVLDGTWTSTDTWDGFKEGTVEIAPYNDAVPDDVAAARRRGAAAATRTAPTTSSPARSTIRTATLKVEGRRGDAARRSGRDRLVRQGRPERVLRRVGSGPKSG